MDEVGSWGFPHTSAWRKESSPLVTLGFMPLGAGPEPNLQRMRGVAGLHETPAGPSTVAKG